MATVADDLPELTLPDANAWHDWLADHHGDPTGVWLALAKKGAAEPTTLTYGQALDEALCFGWIDGQVRRGNSAFFWQRFTPRRARSPWSARNVGNVKRLTAAGRMQPSGLDEVDRARADGRWDAAYAGPRDITVPGDLAEALRNNPAAATMFDKLNSQNRFAILYRLGNAKRAETRTRRLEQFVGMLERGETIYPQKR